MKILIVSFDKGLIKKLKNLLPSHEVIEVKNGEEAIKTVRTDVDVIIYDAISGALSEEDINNMYKQRFGEAKFIILVDELFPVDMGNILPPNKVKLSREDEVDKIPEVLEGAPAPAEVKPEEKGTQEEFVIEHTTFESPQGEQPMEVKEEVPQEFPVPSFDMPSTGEEKETFPVESQEISTVKESFPPTAPSDGKNKVLIVSFDSLLIDNVRNTLGEDFTVEVAKNTKEAMEKKTDAPVVIYDAISGIIAEKGLMEMSQDEEYSKKSYIILIDELFPISVDHIPLDSKIVLSREAEIHLIKEKVEEALASLPKEMQTQDRFGEEKVSAAFAEKQPISEVKEEKEEKPEPQPISVDYPEDINIEELSKTVVEEVEEEKKEVQAVQEIRQPVEQKIDVSINAEDIVNRLIDSVDFESIIKKAIKESIDEDMISSLLRQEIESAFANVDVKGIIKEVVAGILKEKVEELLS